MPPKRANHWSHDGQPGSYFHELVVLPTLAPHLAHPEYLDPNSGTFPFPLSQPHSQQPEHGTTVTHGQILDRTSQSSLSHNLYFILKTPVTDDVVGPADNAGNTEAPGSSVPADEAESLADGSTEAGELFCHGFRNSTLISVVPPLDSV